MMSTIQLLRWSKGLDHHRRVRYAGWVAVAFVSKIELAAQAWRPLARFFFDTVRHRQRVLIQEGLTPNDVRALMVLDSQQGRTMGELVEPWSVDASRRSFNVVRLWQ